MQRLDRAVPHRPLTRRELALLAGLIGASLIFALDLRTPLGINVGVIYVGCVLIGLASTDRRLVIPIAALCSVLTLLGWALSPPGSSFPQVLANRAVALSAIWCVALVGMRLAQEREQHERTLRQERDFSEFVIQSLPGIFYLFSEESRFLRWNQSLEQLSGYGGEEIARMSPLDFIAAEDRARVSERIQEVFSKGEASVEARFVTKDGRHIAHFFTGRRVVVGGGTCLLGSGIDITDRKRAEDLLRAKSLELERSNRELESFAYAVSHDLKAPLRGIVSLAEWLTEDHADRLGGDAAESIQAIRKRARRLHAMIEAILEYSRAGRLGAPLERVSSRDVLAEVLEGLVPPPGIRVRTEGSFPRLRCDPVQLGQVFQNLVDNAIRHLGRDTGEIVIRARAEGGAAVFEVADDGVGIAAEHQERIFRLFQTLGPGHDDRATGLGLAIVKKIVEAHGGTLGVQSAPGSGTTFRFSLPERPA